MSRPMRNVLGVTAVGAVAMALAAGPAAAETEAADVEPGLLAAMAAEMGTDTAGAEQALELQAEAASVSEELETEAGAGYAGTWLDEGSGTVYAAVTDAAAAAAAEAAGAEPVDVAFSLDDLEAAAADLGSESVPSDVASWWIDVESNTVVVEVTGEDTSAAEELVASAGVSEDAVSYTTGADAPQTFADIRGGIAYIINGASRCSVGFAVQGGFVTAGHCGSAGDSTTYGTFQGSSFPGDDYAWVSTPGHNPVGEVDDYNGGAVAVAGSTPAPVGSTVCRSGSTTGWYCGQIQAYNATVNYAEGSVYGLIRTSVCAEPGDSGGSLIAGDQAQGVTSGGSGDCTYGGTTYFQPVNEILDTYGLTLVTS